MREFHFAHPTGPLKDSRHEVLFIDLEPYRRVMEPEQFTVFEQRYNEALAVYQHIHESTSALVVTPHQSDYSAKHFGTDTLTDLDEHGIPTTPSEHVPAIIPTTPLTDAQREEWDMYAQIVKIINTALKESGEHEEPWDFAYDIGFMVLKDAAHRYLVQRYVLTEEEWRWVDRALGPIFTSATAVIGPANQYRAVRETVQAECITQLDLTRPGRSQELERGIEEFAGAVAAMEKIHGYAYLEKQGVARSDAMSNVARSWQDPKKASPLGLTTFEQAMEREFAQIDTVKGRF